MTRWGTTLALSVVLAACDGGEERPDAATSPDASVAILCPGRPGPRVDVPREAQRAVLSVTVEGDGAGRVRSDPPGLDCELPCEASFPIGTRVNLTLEPAYRTTAEGFSHDGCGASCTVSVDRDLTIAARFVHHPPFRLSETDRDPEVRLRDDGLAADFYIHGGVRSVQRIAPGSGAFYFEGRVLIDDRTDLGFGVATASAPLLDTYAGETDQGFGVHADGSIFHDGEWSGRVEGASAVFGLVVDYRSASPVVHVVAPDGAGSRVAHSQPLESIGAPLHVFAAGSKRAPDFQLEINAGGDVENVPFALDPRAALRAADMAELAEVLVLGFGDSYEGPPDEAPILTTSADLVVESGTPVTVTASAMDAEEGDLSGSIEWELLSSPHYAGRLRGVGSTFSFTPTAVGLHPARARVRDRTGRVVERVVRVRVPGPVAQHAAVRLVPDARSGGGIELSPDGLSARWTRTGKRGIRVNQSLYGGWGYFEIRRLVEPVNEGGGLVVGDGNLDPYSWADVPASCSVNMLSGVWHDLVWVADFPGPARRHSTFGFAVDYRGEHPIVYVIARDGLVTRLVLDDVWVEVYPMIYGDPTGATDPGEYDEAIELGANGFELDPVAVLEEEGVDTTGFVPGWGRASTRR